jgi:cephalosporin hydroxylase
MKKSLKQILKEYNLNITSNPDYGTDKGEPKSYIDEFYQKTFEPFSDEEITLVEIGIRSGASIKLWREFFSKANIIGIDNLQDHNDNRTPINKDWISDGVKFIDFDAYSEKIFDILKTNIDILIDDGPHTLESHIKLLEMYIPKMNSGGMIIIEDISYNPNNLYNYVPDYLKEKSYVCDYGGYDNRLIVLEF